MKVEIFLNTNGKIHLRYKSRDRSNYLQGRDIQNLMDQVGEGDRADIAYALAMAVLKWEGES